jgi:hypothetical protein
MKLSWCKDEARYQLKHNYVRNYFVHNKEQHNVLCMMGTVQTRMRTVYTHLMVFFVTPMRKTGHDINVM